MTHSKERPISRNHLPTRLVGAAAIVAISILVSPFVMQGNELAMGFFGLLVGLATPLLNLYGAKWYAEAGARDELTRYGLQAWRNLDSLQI